MAYKEQAITPGTCLLRSMGNPLKRMPGLLKQMIQCPSALPSWLCWSRGAADVLVQEVLVLHHADLVHADLVHGRASGSEVCAFG